MATFTGADKAIGFLFEMVSNIAADYDSSATYTQGAYAIHAGTLYKCTTTITTAEDFNPTHWLAVLIMDEVAAGGGGGGGSSTLAGLSDVSLSSLTNGDVLTYDSAIHKWKNAAGGGGGSAHTYSTTEQIIGVWVDGSTLYEKTITGLNIPLSWYNQYFAQGILQGDFSYIKDLVSVFGTQNDNSYLETYGLTAYIAKNNPTQITLQGLDASTINTLVIQYTKTV